MSSSPYPQEDWHHRTTDELLIHFATTAAGLSSTEAAKRLTQHGPNQLQEVERMGPWHLVMDQFKSLVIWVLIGAGIVSALLGEGMGAVAIFAIVVLNALIGFYQEFNAEKSIAALKLMTAPQAKVLRDGKLVVLPAAVLVVGDVLMLEAGDLVAADARLITCSSLSCVESALTGEAEASGKQRGVLPRGDIPLGDRNNMIFMGTSVATGTGKAVVVATAMQTELGHIAGMMASAGPDERTPLEKKLESFGRLLVWAALGIVALLFGLGLLRGTPMFDLLMTSVSLAVAAVPEGLPAIVTVALALGVSRMAKRRALVRKLSAVETLGSTNVICTDKTGTLTLGEMTVQMLFVDDQSYTVTGNGYNPKGEVLLDGKRTANASIHALATIAVACNNAHIVEENGVWKTIGDPTEGALLAAGMKAGVTREVIERDFPKHHEIPFDSDRKRSTVIRRMPDGKLRAFLNGAPSVLLDLCTQLHTDRGIRPLTSEDRTRILAQTETMAQGALRVLASAYRDDVASNDLSSANVECDLVFVGLSGMHDPPRPEAKEAVTRCRNAGIRVVMITGDHPQTAAAIAREIGIASPDDVAISGVELDKMSDNELRERAEKIAVYARLSAKHKLRIIHAWKANGAVVAMTGDGVNDAPAIKGADIGIAMGKGGTEVTRQAADMIITDDNFATIVTAIEEGRGIYSNIRKTLQYLLAGSTAELLIMAICVIIGLPSPLLPIHLLWINLITDGLPALCLATDAIDSDVMKQSPRHRNESIADGSFLRTMLITGALTTAVTFVVYSSVLKTQNLEAARSSAFAVLVFAELLRAFGARSETEPVWRISLFTNINLLSVIAASFGLQILAQHNRMLGRFLSTSPMSFGDGLVLIAFGAIPLIVLEIFKVVRARHAVHSVKG